MDGSAATVERLLVASSDLPDNWRVHLGRQIIESVPVTQLLPIYSHAHVLPLATYSPWLKDEAFLSIYKAVSTNTLLDPMRAWEVWELALRCARYDAAFLEVGVWRGGSGALIARAAERNFPTRRVYLADTFAGTVKGGSEDTYYRMRDGLHSDTTSAIVEELLTQNSLNNCEILTGVFPEDTAHLVQDDTFSFAHIDVDTYRSALDVFDWVFPRLVIGGIVIFDDYGFLGCEGVTKLVNDMKTSVDRVCIHNLNGHAVVVKVL